MANSHRLLSKLNLVGKAGFPGTSEDPEDDGMMSDVRYLRQSSALINDALQKGFDVLQLADGDIVMTGVKTVVYQYSWDSEKGKLMRKTGSARRGRKPKSAKLDQVSLETEDAEG